MRKAIWASHPHVNNDLTFGERAADKLKQGFGSWAFLIGLNIIIVAWVAANTFVLGHPFDPYPFILLNLGLSWLAAQQGGALQIAANRGDRINSEVAVRTEQHTTQLLDMNKTQLAILQRLQGLDDTVDGLAKAVRAALAQPDPTPVPPAAKETP